MFIQSVTIQCDICKAVLKEKDVFFRGFYEVDVLESEIHLCKYCTGDLTKWIKGAKDGKTY